MARDVHVYIFIDYDECDVKNGGCDQHCENTVGSHACSCVIGHTLSKNGASCDDVNECIDVTHPVCPLEHFCGNTLGGYSCFPLSIVTFLPNQDQEKGLL